MPFWVYWDFFILFIKTLNFELKMANYPSLLLKNLIFLSVFFFLNLYANLSTAQVSIGATNYATLKAAFDAINNGTHTGIIAVNITGNTTETASCVLNAHGTGSANYSKINIASTGGPWTVSASLSSNPLLDFNGADNVTINGANNLTFSNAGVDSSSVLRLRNDASNNVFKKINLNGATTATLGVVFFANAMSTGNDNNTIDSCNIAGVGTSLPLNGVFSRNATAGTDNSNNIISNCNVYNFFHASALHSAIHISAGNNNWTITQNKIYQVATRTITTANTISMININGGSGFNINQNTIGYASNTNTGTYTLASTVALRVTAINAAFATSGNNEIQGNTITAFSMTTNSGATTTNGVFAGINIASGNANIGTAASNIIGSAMGTNAIVLTSTTAQALAVGIHSASSGNIDIRNNSVGAIKSAGLTAALGGMIMGINISGASATCKIQNNTIGNATAHNLVGGNLTTPVTTTGVSVVTGINVATSAAALGSLIIQGNTVQNITAYGTGTNSFVRGIGTPNSSAVTISYVIADNTINNLTTNGGLISIAGAGGTATGIVLGSGTNVQLSGNTISNINVTNATVSATNAVGIGIANAKNAKIFKNKIFAISNSSTNATAATPATASGVLVRSATESVKIYNNMVSLGGNQSANTVIAGIYLNHGTTPDPLVDTILYNTIYIGGLSTLGIHPSFGIIRSDFSAAPKTTPVWVRNNLISNQRMGGTGKHYAIGNGYGGSASSTGWDASASNFNVLNADAATIGWWNGDAIFNTWKTNSAGDANSQSGVTVNFVSTSNGDLHLNMGTASTVLESNGIAIANLTTDFDNQSRPGPMGSTLGGGTAPDIGADEFDGATGDAIAPIITISAIVTSCSNADRTFSAVISDASGLPITGAMIPKVYFRKNKTGSWQTASGILSSGNANSGTWDFTISHAAVGGVVSGDVIEYFVLAQDIYGNVKADPFTGTYATNVNTLINPPTLPLNYQIGFATLNGTYQVGAAQPFAFRTISNAIYTYANACSLGASVVFELTDANYSSNETFPIVINKHSGASATNTLTIRVANGMNTTISGNVANNALIRCNNNFTTIDGSNNGSSSRNLTITNVATNLPRVVDLVSNGSVSLENTTIKNSIIINGANTGSAILIADIAGTVGLNKNLKIQNNDIQRAKIAIEGIATPSVTNGNGLVITENIMNASGANAIKYIGVSLLGFAGATISLNNIGNFESITAEDDIGILIGNQTINTTVTQNTITNIVCNNAGQNAPTAIEIAPQIGGSNIINKNIITTIHSIGSGTVYGIHIKNGTGATISKNKISDIKNLNTTSGWGACGLSLGGNMTTTDNNFIYDIAAKGYKGRDVADNGNGIVVFEGTSHNIYHNSIALTSSQSDTAGYPSAILITNRVNTLNTINILNNIFANMQSFACAYRYTIHCNASASIFNKIDNNVYYSTGPNIAYFGGNKATLADIQNAFGGDLMSAIENPNFLTPTDLHIMPSTIESALESNAEPIVGFNTDIDDLASPNTTNNVNGGGYRRDIGADEFDGTPKFVKLYAKMYLMSTDATTGLMDSFYAHNYTLTNFPLTSPYAVAPYASVYPSTAPPRITTTSVLDVTPHNTAIADWVYIQLRTGTKDTTVVVASTAALLQRDGDIVATNGVSPVVFDVPEDYYFVAVYYKNHIGVRSTDSFYLSKNVSPTLNFGSPTLSISGPSRMINSNIRALIAGDTNIDKSVDGTDDTIWEVENGTFWEYSITSDFNLDGSVDGTDATIWELENGSFEEIH
jgi:hypothetical protein